MQIYHFNHETGEYVGSSEARLDPVAGTPVMPAFATSAAPPEPVVGKAIVIDHDSGQWVLKDDLRGQDHWDATTREYLGPVQDIGPLPAGFSLTEPALPFEEVKAAKLAAIQAEKARVRDGGVEVGGIVFDTDLSARMAYLELATELEADPTYTTQWKANDDGDWVTMDGTLFTQLRSAGKTLMADAFAWQAARNAEVEAATAETIGSVSQTYA